MAEREALKREIEQLQNLIDRHKSVHGDNPFPRVEQRLPEGSASSRGHAASVVRAHNSRGRPYFHHSQSTWRKTYSLSNKNPQPSFSTFSSVHQSHSRGTSQGASLPKHSRGAGPADSSPGISQQRRGGHVTNITLSEKNCTKEDPGKIGAYDDRRGDSSSTSAQQEILLRRTEGSLQKNESRCVVLPELKASLPSEVPSLQSLASKPKVQTKPSQRTSTESKKTTNTLTADEEPSLSLTPKRTSSQVGASFLSNSKFTWVKHRNVAASTSPSGGPLTVAPIPKAAAAAKGGSPSFTVGKKTPSRKLPRKQTLLTKTSKYKWVSSSGGAHPKTPRKSLSPKIRVSPQGALEKGEAAKRLRAVSSPPAKVKRENSVSSNNFSLSSRYRWKAGGQGTSVAAAGGATVARRRSAFHWTSEKGNKGVKGGIIGSPSVAQRTGHTPSSSSGGFKLRSRMKIIRKSPSSGGGSSPQGRVLTRTPIGVRRSPSRDLVAFGRHKLRRLSPSYSRTSPASSSHRGAASHREFRSRYKMVTRQVSSAAHTFHYNPALSWRAKRIQSARSFLQSRLRSPHCRHPSSNQHWRGSNMCWIRGSLYRVSANKLSRTVGSNMSINRTGRPLSQNQTSSWTPAAGRPSSTRHLASRAVQRSLAIIRQARQKKPTKQYCMYYNRFGRCNRGSSCPYIHDPDKVAVCTRFLRGTCKKADGTCPFSHKVAKEKMPVCSYFLKGICNNSDCPYSHVYVSRNAEVCEDFVKGYCPEGEKCKKKHTLVCPDFSKTGSCPRGGRCKLQHRQRTKRSVCHTSTPSAKRVRTKEPSKRPHLSVILPQSSPATPGTPAKGHLALPSFISLSSSPEEADTPDTPLPETSEVKEKKLQIKPRL